MLEKTIERNFQDKAEALGYFVLKLNLMGFRGLPDRLVLGDHAFILFIEFKRPGEEPGNLQEFIIGRLTRYGFNVLVIDSPEKAEQTINALRSRLEAA